MLLVSFALPLSGKNKLPISTTLPVSASTYKIKFTPVKKGSQKINWNKNLPSLYRSRYYKLQGSTTDGKYIYSIYWNKRNDKCIVVKFNLKTKKRIRSSRPLKLYHGNDIAYNPYTRLLYTVDNEEKPYRITIVNPITLTICGKVDVQMPETLEGVEPDYIPFIDRFVGITYDSSRRQYALRVSGFNDFIITDEAFTPLRYITASKEYDIRPQTIDCDQDHVYVTMDKEGSYNIIAVYNWEGIFQYQIRIPLKYEIQSICHIGSYHYATFYQNKNNKPKSYIYKFRMP
jgi:hypothetical protein